MKMDREEIINIYKEIIEGKRKKFPRYFWNKSSVKEVGTFVLRTLLKWNDEEVLRRMNKEIIAKYELMTPLIVLFEVHIDEMLNFILEKNYNRWEYRALPTIKSTYWSQKKNRESAFKWLEDKLDRKKRTFEEDDFSNNGLITLYNYIVKNDLKGIRIIEDKVKVYNKILKGNKLYYPEGYWTDDTIKKICRYVFFDVIKYKTNEEVIQSISTSILREYKLYGVMKLRFDNKLTSFINFVLETEYNAWEFKKIPNKFWENADNRKKATEWLSKKVKKNKDELLITDYINHGIRGAIDKENSLTKKSYWNNTKKAINKIEKEACKDKSKIKVFDRENSITIFKCDELIEIEEIEAIKKSAKILIEDITMEELYYIEYVVMKEINKKYKEIKIIIRNELYMISLGDYSIKKVRIRS